MMSAIIPVYNGQLTIAAAIDSALGLYDECELEVVVIDDGSTDSTPAILARYGDRIRLIQGQQRGGRSVALNRAVRESRGEYLAFLDADDLWLSGRLHKALGVLQADPSAGVAFCNCLVAPLNEQGPTQPFVFDGAPSLKEMFEHPLPILRTTVTMRREIFTMCGGFDERLSYGEDYCLWLEARQRCTFVHIPEFLAVYRIGPTGRYSKDVRSLFESVLYERYGRRAKKLISKLHDQRARQLLSLVFQQMYDGTHDLAWHTLIELLRDRPSYLVRANPTKVLRVHNLKRMLALGVSGLQSSFRRCQETQRGLTGAKAGVIPVGATLQDSPCRPRRPEDASPRYGA